MMNVPGFVCAAGSRYPRQAEAGVVTILLAADGAAGHLEAKRVDCCAGEDGSQ